MMPERHFFTHRHLRLSYLDSAPDDLDRPAVLLLHGFPDQATMWMPQIQALHQAGFRCIAPDTVGCGQSDMAPKKADYHVDHIIADHLALMTELGIRRSHVVGHDWGAVIAWVLAGTAPDQCQQLAVMSVGHPTAYARAGWGQKRAGWYTLFFQLGGVADRLLAGRGRFSLRRIFGSHPDMDEVMTRFAEPGRLQAAVRIYRANMATMLLTPLPRVSANTLALWSTADPFLTEDQMLNSRRWVDGSWQYQRLEGGHWMSLEKPDHINSLLIDHFR